RGDFLLAGVVLEPPVQQFLVAPAPEELGVLREDLAEVPRHTLFAGLRHVMSPGRATRLAKIVSATSGPARNHLAMPPRHRQSYCHARASLRCAFGAVRWTSRRGRSPTCGCWEPARRWTS